MAFKSLNNYNEEKFGDFFTLRDDGNFADVVFLYQSVTDVLVADVHYLKSAEYSGYAHCCGRGCPACGKGIRVQTKLFIPVYNIQNRKIEFWDRTIRFEPQLQKDVFANYPNPSEYVFRITRHGAAGDVNTVYEIKAIGKNSSMPYSSILADNNMTLPDGYSQICRDLSSNEMASMLNANAAAPTEEYSYTPVPRSTTPTVVPQSYGEPLAAPEMTIAEFDALPMYTPDPDTEPSAEPAEFNAPLPEPTFGDSFASSDVSDTDVSFE